MADLPPAWDFVNNSWYLDWLASGLHFLLPWCEQRKVFYFFTDGVLRGSCWFQSVLDLYPVIWPSTQSLVFFYLRNRLPCYGAPQKAQISTKKIPTNDSSYSWSGRNPSTCKDTLLCTVSLWDGLCETTKMQLQRHKLHLHCGDY